MGRCPTKKQMIDAYLRHTGIEMQTYAVNGVPVDGPYGPYGPGRPGRPERPERRGAASHEDYAAVVRAMLIDYVLNRPGHWP